jgi:hypothetical protein
MALLFAPTLAAQPPQVKPTVRHVFVLHDGFHTILSYPRPDWAAQDMKQFLIHHGVNEADIILMPCPFQPASFQDMFPKAGFEYFLNCFNPASKSAQKSYVQLDSALKDRGVRPTDKLIWIGHSAGGQIGMTMAHLGGNLKKYPELARVAGPHPFDMVVTLGSPLGLRNDLVPAGVKRRHYYSPADRVVHLAWVAGNLALPLLGYKDYKIELVPVPSRLSPDTVVRIFHGIEHPSFPKDEHVMMRILNEYRDDYQPAWRGAAISPTFGPGLAGLMCRALEADCRYSIEDPLANE